MTLKGNLSKVSVALGLIITIVTLISGGVRIIDLTQQTASTVEKLSERIDTEEAERIAQDAVLKDAIVKERETRSAEYTKIQVKLTEIDTRLLYIQQGIDSINRQ